MNITIEVPWPLFIVDLFDSNRISQGMQRQAPGGATLTLGPPPYEKKSFPQLEQLYVPVLISLAANVAVNVVSSWLYDKLREGKITRIRVNRTEIEVTKDGITKLISESVEIEK